MDQINQDIEDNDETENNLDKDTSFKQEMSKFNQRFEKLSS
jgi:hypothetical protein